VNADGHKGAGALPASQHLLGFIATRKLGRPERRGEGKERTVSLSVGEAGVTELVGVSRHIVEVNRAIRRLAPIDRTVTVVGETGTGKQVVARLLHEHSRRKGALVMTSAGEIPSSLFQSEYFGHERGAFTGAEQRTVGLVEAAHNGTLLIDEVQDLPQEHQQGLRHFLEGHGFQTLGGRRRLKPDVRVVAASQCPLGELVSQQRLRSDVRYRLEERVIRLLPLRERMEDLEPLCAWFLGRLAGELGRDRLVMSPRALRELQRRPWPGNVRELYWVLDEAAFDAEDGVIEPWHLRPEDGYGGLKLVPPPAGAAEVEQVLRTCRGRVSLAARRWAVTDRTVRRWVEAHRIDLERIRRECAGGER
jgi:DNA-binding NtrC family response regulator